MAEYSTNDDVHSLRRARSHKSTTNRRLLWIPLFFLFCIGTVHSECPSFGCSSNTLDIASDGPLADAMQVLRRGTGSESEDDGVDQEQAVKTALSTLQSTGDQSSLTLTLCGAKGPGEQINQDRALLIRPFRILKDDKPTTIQILGVFDGHGEGGEKTSQHALEQVPKLLDQKLALIADDSIDNLLQGSEHVEAAVKLALKEVFLEVDQTDPTKGAAGCTATVILQLGSKLYIANAGDSISFVGVYFRPKNSPSNAMEAPQEEQMHIIYETREDKPDLPDEKERILKMGGYVHIPVDPNQDVPRAYFVDENGNMQWGLAMSRSLGDWTVQGVIAEPIVDVLNIRDVVESALALHAETCNKGDNERVCDALDPSDVHIFAVSASDGMMDELTSQYIGMVLARTFFDQEINVHPLIAAEHLILEAAKGWNRLYGGQYRDDIAIAAATIPWDSSMLSSK